MNSYILGIFFCLYISSAQECDLTLNSNQYAREYEGKCYLFIAEPRLNWQNAKDYCETKGGNLAVVNSKAINTYLTEQLLSHDINQSTSNRIATWIGLSCEKEEGNYVWVTGQPLGTFQRFRSSMLKSPTLDCVRMDARYNYEWTLGSCKRSSRVVANFICEKSYNTTSNMPISTTQSKTAMQSKTTAQSKTTTFVPAPAEQQSSQTISTPVAIGAICGGAALIVLIIAVVFVVNRRKKQKEAAVLSLPDVRYSGEGCEVNDNLLTAEEEYLQIDDIKAKLSARPLPLPPLHEPQAVSVDNPSYRYTKTPTGEPVPLPQAASAISDSPQQAQAAGLTKADSLELEQAPPTPYDSPRAAQLQYDFPQTDYEVPLLEKASAMYDHPKSNNSPTSQ